MRGLRQGLALACAAGLGACAAVPPSAPTVMALPAQGKSFAQFQQEDLNCRAYAQQVAGGAAEAQASTNNSLLSAGAGTLLGAGAGALLGAVGGNVGAGAAVGAGAGLALGAGAGANDANATTYSLQQRYDVAYTQCMYADGNKVTSTPPSGYAAPAYGYPAYPGYPAPAYAYPGFYEGPTIGFGFGFGGFHDHDRYWHHRRW